MSKANNYSFVGTQQRIIVSLYCQKHYVRYGSSRLCDIISSIPTPLDPNTILRRILLEFYSRLYYPTDGDHTEKAQHHEHSGLWPSDNVRGFFPGQDQKLVGEKGLPLSYRGHPSLVLLKNEPPNHQAGDGDARTSVSHTSPQVMLTTRGTASSSACAGSVTVPTQT